MRQIFLDTETTGLSAEGGDRIIEIGCVELLNRKLTGHNLHFYLNPERDSHEDALKVHGISNDFLRDKPKFAQVAQEVLDYLAASGKSPLCACPRPCHAQRLGGTKPAENRALIQNHARPAGDTCD